MNGRRVSVRRGRFKGWEALLVERPPLALALVPQVGGRIMGMSWRGRQLAFTMPGLEGRVEDVAAVADLRRRKRELGFPLWGGDKTWLAPQARWSEGVPFLDLDSGAYASEVEMEGPEEALVRMTSPVCRETGVRVTRTVTLEQEEEGWTVIHRLENASDREVEWGPWDVAMVLRPGRVYLPTRAQSPHPEGIKTFVEEGVSAEVRERVVSYLGSVAVVACEDTLQFKFGSDAEEGWMLGVVDVGGGDLIGYRKQVAVVPGASYGHGCVAEVFNSADYPYLEMEIHGPVVRLAAGASTELVEHQALIDIARWPQSEEELRQHLAALACPP
ncbi:MAG: hypothetical protein ACE5JZ_03225 [Kiloniellales bacterium]